MDSTENISFTSCVVCEYVRHWDTHLINQDVGVVTDAVVKEIEAAGRLIDFGFAGEFQSLFGFTHYREESAPSWILDNQTVRENRSPLNPFKYGYLVLSSDVEISAEQFRNAVRNPDGTAIEDGEYSDEALIHIYKDFVSSTLNDYAFLFSIAANIARPGSFQFIAKYLFADHNLIRKSAGTLNSFDSAYKVYEKFSWPPLIELSVFQVWDWLVKVPGFTSGESKTALGRAIGAISYLLNDNFKDQNELALVWALIGLEALYSKGSKELKSQLVEKTEIFLGTRVSHKKEFGNVYDFRSRLVHGDKNFNFNGFAGVLEEEFSMRLWDSENFAVATLVSTLQKMCEIGMNELSFSLVLGSQIEKKEG